MFKFRTTISVQGFNQVRLLNRLSGSGIKLYRVYKRNPSEMSITVNTKQLDKAIAIMQNLCYTFENTHQSNLLRAAAKKIWIPIAAVVLTAIVFASNMFVWNIDISGSSGLTLVNVEKLVADSGLRMFSYKPTDLTTLENNILSLDEVAAVSVGMSGNTLKIKIVESGYTTPIERGGPIISDYDAVVTRIITESGTPLVARGDVVRSGQPLIGGELTATADGAVTASVQAKGSVYGTVTFMFSLIMGEGVSWVPTGRVQKETALEIFGAEWKGGDCEFECYRAVTKVNQFFCFTLTQTIYEELAAEQIGADITAYTVEKSTELSNVYGTEFETKYIIEPKGGVDVVKLYLSAELLLGNA